MAKFLDHAELDLHGVYDRHGRELWTATRRLLAQSFQNGYEVGYRAGLAAAREPAADVNGNGLEDDQAAAAPGEHVNGCEASNATASDAAPIANRLAALIGWGRPPRRSVRGARP